MKFQFLHLFLQSTVSHPEIFKEKKLTRKEEDAFTAVQSVNMQPVGPLTIFSIFEGLWAEGASVTDRI